MTLKHTSGQPATRYASVPRDRKQHLAVAASPLRPHLNKRTRLPERFAGRSENEPFGDSRYDWAKQELAETIEVDPRQIVIVEGIYSTRPELRDHYDLRIWVETSQAKRMRRQIARGENTSQWIKRWAAAEMFYVDTFLPSQSAHAIVAGAQIPEQVTKRNCWFILGALVGLAAKANRPRS